MHFSIRIALCCGLIACGAMGGCEGRPSLIPNSDPALNKTSTQFASDAVRRFPYPAAAPKAGEAKGRAQVDVMVAQLQILNYSEEDWDDIDIWVNQSYVCHVPRIPRGKEKVETINFQMLYDNQGHHFWTNGGRTPMQVVEMVKGGKVYEIPLALAD